MPLTDSVLQPLVKIVDGTGRHFSNGELARVFVQLFLQLRLGTHGLVDFALKLQQLLLKRLHAGIHGGTQRLLRHLREARHLIVGASDAGTNGRCQILHMKLSAVTECDNSSALRAVLAGRCLPAPFQVRRAAEQLA